MTSLDDLIGIDLTPERQGHLFDQIMGSVLPAPRLPAGLAPFRLIPKPEAPTRTRTRMAAAIAETAATNGSVTHDDLLARGFSGDEIAAHFRDALRASRAADMVI